MTRSMASIARPAGRPSGALLARAVGLIGAGFGTRRALVDELGKSYREVVLVVDTLLADGLVAEVDGRLQPCRPTLGRREQVVESEDDELRCPRPPERVQPDQRVGSHVGGDTGSPPDPGAAAGRDLPAERAAPEPAVGLTIPHGEPAEACATASSRGPEAGAAPAGDTAPTGSGAGTLRERVRALVEAEPGILSMDVARRLDVGMDVLRSMWVSQTLWAPRREWVTPGNPGAGTRYYLPDSVQPPIGTAGQRSVQLDEAERARFAAARAGLGLTQRALGRRVAPEIEGWAEASVASAIGRLEVGYRVPARLAASAFRVLGLDGPVDRDGPGLPPAGGAAGDETICPGGPGEPPGGDPLVPPPGSPAGEAGPDPAGVPAQLAAGAAGEEPSPGGGASRAGRGDRQPGPGGGPPPPAAAASHRPSDSGGVSTAAPAPATLHHPESGGSGAPDAFALAAELGEVRDRVAELEVELEAALLERDEALAELACWRAALDRMGVPSAPDGEGDGWRRAVLEHLWRRL